MARQGAGRLVQHGMPGPVVGKLGDETRNVDDPLVHPAPVGLPAGREAERLEDGVVPLEPAGMEVDPGVLAERQPAEGR